MRPLIIALLLAGCGEGGEVARCGPSRAVVTRVIDGDTVELESGETVRYLMIDTPELTTECYGPEAKTVNEGLVLGQTVELAYDVECEDRYGRLLAYVSVGGAEVNPRLVERGYACVLYIPPNGETRRAEFLDLETRAQATSAGMWGACATVGCTQ